MSELFGTYPRFKIEVMTVDQAGKCLADLAQIADHGGLGNWEAFQAICTQFLRNAITHGEGAKAIENLDEAEMVEAMAQAIYDDPDEEIDCDKLATVAFAAIQPHIARFAAENTRLREALEMVVAEKVDYMTINNLGDPEKQHTIMLARAALGEKP